MKTTLLPFLIAAMLLMLQSCAVHNPLTQNLNTSGTEVQLSRNNFKVIQKVSGSAEALYVFGIGGLSKSALASEARAQMLGNANLLNGPKAVINESVEYKHTFFPFVRLFKVTVSGYIIEFTE